MRENMRDLTSPELYQCAGGAGVGEPFDPIPIDPPTTGLVKIPRPINIDPPVAPPVGIPGPLRLK